LRNKEYLFVVSERRDAVEAVVAALEASIADAALARSASRGKRKTHEVDRSIER
jgi:hypothetical protein